MVIDRDLNAALNLASLVNGVKAETQPDYLRS